MARLWDTSRDKASGGTGGYSLEGLSTEIIKDPRVQKISMKELFGKGKLRKDGTESRVKELPPMTELQTLPEHRDNWIEYSAKDAVATWLVMQDLKIKLELMPWKVNGRKLGTMFDFYFEYLREFGELLTEMESNGIKVDTQGHLREAEVRAREDREKMLTMFIDWASLRCADAKYINTASTTQIQQLFFGEYDNKILINEEKTFKIDKDEAEFAEENRAALAENPYANTTSEALGVLLKERKLKLSGSKSDKVQRLLEYDAKEKLRQEGGYVEPAVENPYADATSDQLSALLKERNLKVTGKKADKVQRLLDYDAKEKLKQQEGYVEQEPKINYKDCTMSELKAMIKERDLKATGIKKKADLIQLLVSHDLEEEKKKRGEEGQRKEEGSATAPTAAESEVSTVVVAQAASADVASANEDANEVVKVSSEQEPSSQSLEDKIANSVRAMYAHFNDSELLDTLYSRKLANSGGKPTREEMLQTLILDAQYTVAYEIASNEMPATVPQTVTTPSESPAREVEVEIPGLASKLAVQPPKKYREITIKTLRLTPLEFTPTGIPQVSATVLRKMAGKNPFGEGE
jgi:hypothetical protein